MSALGHMERIMKRVMWVSVPVAALLVALSAGDARAQSRPWSVSFDLSTQVALSGDLHGGGSGSEWLGGATVAIAALRLRTAWRAPGVTRASR